MVVWFLLTCLFLYADTMDTLIALIDLQGVVFASWVLSKLEAIQCYKKWCPMELLQSANTQYKQRNLLHPQLTSQHPNTNTLSSTLSHSHILSQHFYNHINNYPHSQEIQSSFRTYKSYPTSTLRTHKNLGVELHTHTLRIEDKKILSLSNSFFFFAGNTSYDMLNYLIYPLCLVVAVLMLNLLRVYQRSQACHNLVVTFD